MDIPKQPHCPKCGQMLHYGKEYCEPCFQKKLRLRAEAHDKLDRMKRERGIDTKRNIWYDACLLTNNQIQND